MTGKPLFTLQNFSYHPDDIHRLQKLGIKAPQLLDLMRRHSAGDWGHVCDNESFAKVNQAGLTDPSGFVSSYFPVPKHPTARVLLSTFLGKDEGRNHTRIKLLHADDVPLD